MTIMDMSTRKLKRYYIRCLKDAWRYQSSRRDGPSKDIGVSGYYWEAHNGSTGAKEELRRRGVFVA